MTDIYYKAAAAHHEKRKPGQSDSERIGELETSLESLWTMVQEHYKYFESRIDQLGARVKK